MASRCEFHMNHDWQVILSDSDAKKFKNIMINVQSKDLIQSKLKKAKSKQNDCYSRPSKRLKWQDIVSITVVNKQIVRKQ